MQKWSDGNDNLMYSIHSEGKSVVADMYIRTFKRKIYNKMRTNDSKSYLSYLNNLLDKYNNIYLCSVTKKPIDVDYYALSERFNLVIKILILKLVIESGLLSTRIFLEKITPKIG